MSGAEVSGPGSVIDSSYRIVGILPGAPGEQDGPFTYHTEMTMVASSRDALLLRLGQILPAGAVLSDPSELYVYEFDALTIARSHPAAICFPTTTEQVSRIMKVLAELDVPIVPRGSGTGLAGGCVAYENGVVISTARMNHILQIDLENRVAHVEAG